MKLSHPDRNKQARTEQNYIKPQVDQSNQDKTKEQI